MSAAARGEDINGLWTIRTSTAICLGNYKYNLTGYLHWAATVISGQNPQKTVEHRNADAVTILPPGDTHITVPAGQPDVDAA